MSNLQIRDLGSQDTFTLILPGGDRSGNVRVFVDTTVHWAAKTEYIPSQGDIIVYSDRNTIDNKDYPGVKIGDGESLLSDLPFVGDDISAQIIATLEEEINAKYTKPVDGIPASDLSAEVQASLDSADSAYQKPVTGIPASDLSADVQTSLDSADSAYQKPNGGIPYSDLASDVTEAIESKLEASEKGVANGVAELDSNGKVPSSQLPGYVDDVVEYASLSEFPETGESGKIYVALDTNKTYRWGGSSYVEISASLTLGETESTAYRGDRGAAAYAAAVTNVETVPTENSSNLITSGAVYEGLSGKVDDVTVGGTSVVENGIASIPALTSIIDDASGSGDTNKTWSSDKLASEVSNLSEAVSEKYTKPATGIPASDIEDGVIPEVPVTDVQVNGETVVSDGIATIPYAGSNQAGVVAINDNAGISVEASTHVLRTSKATDMMLRIGTNSYCPVVPSNEHVSTFYGLAKASGDATQSASGNQVGTYTNNAQTSIQKMLGVYGKISSSEKGAPNGVAALDNAGKVLTSQLPSYVDDVVEYASLSEFPETGESGKIYIALDTNKTYRWSGSSYVEISASLALGETENTAYRGDRGKAAYDHSAAKGSQFSSGLYKIQTNAEGHVTEAVAVEKTDITALGIPAQDTTYSVATDSADGLMSSTDKALFDAIDDTYVVKQNAVVTNSLSMGRKANTTIGLASTALGDNVTASSDQAHAEGYSTTASNYQAHAEGLSTIASGMQSHAEGNNTTASGAQSHAEGNITIASGDFSHTEGMGGTYTSSGTTYTSAAAGTADHTEGYQCLTAANQPGNHAEGYQTRATGGAAHSEGSTTFASGSQSHAEGSGTIASGTQSHAEGYSTTASGSQSHAEGIYTTAVGTCAHAEGQGGDYTLNGSTYISTASGMYSHTEGQRCIASAASAHAEGSMTRSTGSAAHTEGQYTLASNQCSHAEGYGGTFTADGVTYTSAASGMADHVEGYICYTASSQPGNHAEGYQTRATGGAAHSEGNYTLASGTQSHAEGSTTKSTGTHSHAEGYNTLANASQSHAEGTDTTAYSTQSHAEGHTTVAAGQISHAEGYYTTASGDVSHTEGEYTTALGYCEHVSGAYNKLDDANAWAANTSYTVGQLVKRDETYTINGVTKTLTKIYKCKTANSDSTFNSGKWERSGQFLFVVGNGTPSYRSNAFSVGWYGNVAEGSGTTATGNASHAEGGGTTASAVNAHAEGGGSRATGPQSHAEGSGTTASGTQAHSEGAGTQATGPQSHAEGAGTTASGAQAHSEGAGAQATGDNAHAEGASTTASALNAHAEGSNTIAAGTNSHAGGILNIADSYDNWDEWVANTSYEVGDKVKVTSGSGTSQTVNGYICKIANSDSSFTSSHWTDQYGKMNYVEIIGNGIYPDRSNARTLDWNGNERLMGQIYVGCNADSTGGTQLTPPVEMTGATSSAAGAAGYVPAPAAGDNEKFLRGDGTWVTGGNPMVVLSYGNSTWQDFINAYNNNVIVYCRASSNSNPASGSQTRMAFMAYVNDASNPTNVEFQYYRSVTSHSASQQGDQVFVYKLDSSSGWTVTTREASSKVVAGTNMSSSYSSGTITLSADLSSRIATTEKGAASGVAELDANGKVPSSQLPSYVDDVIEGYYYNDKFYEEDTHTTEITAEADKIYIDVPTNKTYRWSGSAYVAIGSDLALGETSSTAYRGDRGAAAYAAAVTNVESSPSSGSSNLVTSGGVYTALDDKAPKDSPVFTGSVSMGRKDNTTVGSKSVAVGNSVEASATGTFATGGSTKATSAYAHAEGVSTTASGSYSHSEGEDSTASGRNAHAENRNTTASGDSSSARGYYTTANHRSQVTSGEYNVLDASSATASNRGNYVEIVGNGASASSRSNARTLDWDGNERLMGDIYVGCNADSSGGTKLTVPVAMTGADGTNAGTAGYAPAPAATDNTKYLKGDGTWADVDALPAVTTSDNGKVLKVASGDWSVEDEQDISELAPKASPVFTGSISLGRKANTTVGTGSMAIGSNAQASDSYSSAIGVNVTASGSYSNAINGYTTASGDYSSAEGMSTVASGIHSHTEGMGTRATHKAQHAAGAYNVIDPSSAAATDNGNYVEIIGNGTANNARSNARTLDWSGNERLMGQIYVGCNADSTGGTQLTPPVAMTGATSSAAGTAGYVPAPAAGDDTKFLRGDGTWAEGGGGLETLIISTSITNASGQYTNTISDSRITSDMIAYDIAYGTPSVIKDDVEVECDNGEITISCDNAVGTTTVTLYIMGCTSLTVAEGVSY